MNKPKKRRRNRRMMPAFEHGAFKLEKHLGSGGNGDVWLAKDSVSSETVAVKFLTKMRPKPYERFKSEVGVLRKLGDHAGIVPILGAFIPSQLGPEPPWYAMPVCEPARSVLGTTMPLQLAAFATLAGHLADLHSIGIYHRDLKVDNLLSLQGTIRLSDFGLAEWHDAPDVTQMGEPVGPMWTLAPEMRRTASASAGGPADVYSFAKMLWIVLTAQKKGFDGQYSSKSGNIALRNQLSDHLWIRPIESLLTDCTAHDPEQRPTMTEVKARLTEWQAASEDFHTQCLLEWQHMQAILFGENPPNRAVWRGVGSIASVLNTALSHDNLNHCFFPRSGGLDLRSCEIRDGLLELQFGIPYIAKPAFLEVVVWPDYAQWSYFWLELEPQSASGVYDDYDGLVQEELVRLPDGTFINRSAWDSGVNDENGDLLDLPAEADLVVRLLEGALVIFAKRSPYNLDTHTYDGRHNSLGREQFFAYIEAHVAWEHNGREGAPDVGKGAPTPVGFRLKRAPLS